MTPDKSVRVDDLLSEEAVRAAVVGWMIPDDPAQPIGPAAMIGMRSALEEAISVALSREEKR